MKEDWKALVVGKCETMCPLSEFNERKQHKDLHPLEYPSDSKDNVSSMQYVVKKYRRAAAGRLQQNEFEIRTQSTLSNTITYLLSDVVSRSDDETSSHPIPFSTIYHFIDDRIRSVRQDYTIQGINNNDYALDLLRIFRFYAVAGCRMHSFQNKEHCSTSNYSALMKQTETTFSVKLHLEQMSSCLTTLKECSSSDNEAQFISYDILLRMFDEDILSWSLARFTHSIRNHDAVQKAINIAIAARLGHFSKFFKLFHSLCYVEKCIVLWHLPRALEGYLKTLNYAYRKQDCFPLSDIAKVVGNVSVDTMVQLCELYNIPVEAHVPQSNDSWESKEDHVTQPQTAYISFNMNSIHLSGNDTSKVWSLFAVEIERKRSALYSDLALGILHDPY